MFRTPLATIMLSQNPTTIQQRQRQHRRQQSTPNVFDPAKVQPLQQQSSHRRGISVDRQQRRQSTQQEYTVSNTNQGFQQQHPQHILRETQQQRHVRPGSQPQPFLNFDNDENFLISPLVSPHRQEFDAGCMSYDASRQAQASYPYSGPVNTVTKVDPNMYSSFGGQDLPLYPDGSLTPSAYLDFSASFEDMSGQQNWAGTIKPIKKTNSSRRISGGIASRVAQFEGMAGQQPASRPITPPTQNTEDYFPPTPASTPFNRNRQSQPIPQRFQEGYDTSMEETIKPGRRNQRVQNVFQEMREQSEASRPPSPPGTAPIVSRAKFDSAKMPISSSLQQSSNANMDFLKPEQVYESSYYSPANTNISPEMSQHSSPELSHANLFAPSYDQSQFQNAYPASRGSVDLGEQFSPDHMDRSRRSESVDSLNLEETITETGITIDDIAHYISGPDDAQKWLCLFPSCGKKFGRKENIKSHVQTHLGDRQYQCPHCKKCFVRQHDLKRHAKIHSGVKPYPCACGNSFARHDALTRHRQRGMCIGAFEGVVKKIVKRGRPRKNRPDDEERQNKASRTRSKNNASASQASSASEYSESSYGQSPSTDFDILDEHPFSDFSTQQYSQSSYSQYTAGQSPSYISPNVIQASSPSAYSVHSQASHHSQVSHHSQAMHYRNNSIISVPELDLPEHLSALPSSPSKTAHSHYSPAPELSLSSSSPAAQRFYEASEQSEDLDLGKLADLQMDVNGAGTTIEDMYLDQFGAADDAMMLLDSSMNSKFDDAFAGTMDMNGMGMGGMGMNTVDMLDDVFFGSP